MSALHARLGEQPLDPHQLEAVSSEAERTVVRAQVGSGKTTVLVHTLLDLHRRRGVPLDEIVALTFSRRAAGELRERIARAGIEVERGWLGGTFHSVALRLLREHLDVERLGFSRDFEVLDAAARDELWERLIAAHGLKVRYEKRLAARYEAWRRGRSFGNSKRSDDLVALFALARDEKRRRDCMDFDDLLANATRLVEEGAFRDRPLRPSWILIDELQDTQDEELALVEALARLEREAEPRSGAARAGARGARLFAVGDPSQTIYTWRGASACPFSRLERGGARRLSLPVNYRSTATIVSAAQGFRSGEQALVPSRPVGARLRVLDHHDAISEAHYLAGRLRELNAAGVPWREIALLVRTRRQLEPLASALSRAGLPVARVDSPETPALTWLRRLLRAASRDDPLDARFALAHDEFGVVDPKRLPGPEVAACAGLAELRELIARRAERVRKPADRAALRTALGDCARLAELSTWLELGPSADELCEHLQLTRRLGPTRATYPEDLAATRRALARWLGEESPATQSAATQDAATQDATTQDTTTQDTTTQDATAQDAISLMTLHASKGLEFRWVFICGVNNGLLPLNSAWRDRDARSEERRLFFVGLTRAKDGVELSWYRSPGRSDVLGEPSPFLDELPLEVLDPDPLAASSERTTSDAERTTSEPERTESDAERTASEPERTASDAERATSDAERATSDAEQATSDAERTTSDAERTTNDAEQATSDAERAASEPERAASEPERAASDAERATNEGRSPDSPGSRSGDERPAHDSLESTSEAERTTPTNSGQLASGVGHLASGAERLASGAGREPGRPTSESPSTPAAEAGSPLASSPTSPRPPASVPPRLAPATAGEWFVGQRVRHRKHGVGTVASLSPTHLGVDFPAGPKRFALAFRPPLTPLATR